MVNYGGFSCKQKIDPDIVNREVQKLIEDDLKGLFDLEYVECGFLDKPSWWLSYKDDDYIVWSFWIENTYEYGKEVDGKYEEYPEPIFISENTRLIFEHGHSFGFMYYVEGVLRENLGKLFDGEMYDDGGEIDPVPHPEDYLSFKQHCLLNDSRWEEKSGKKWNTKNWLFPQDRKKITPQEIIDKLELDFLTEEQCCYL